MKQWTNLFVSSETGRNSGKVGQCAFRVGVRPAVARWNVSVIASALSLRRGMFCHCERSEAINSLRGLLTPAGFAMTRGCALAMTMTDGESRQ